MADPEPLVVNPKALFLGCAAVALLAAIVVRGSLDFGAFGRRLADPLKRQVLFNSRVDAAMDRLSPRLNQGLDQHPRFAGLDSEATALGFYRDGASPLAARWTAYTLLEDPDSLLGRVRSTLRERLAWAWRYQGRQNIGHRIRVGQQANEEPRYYLQGYVNEDLPDDPSALPGPLEYYHFAYFLPEGSQYWGSYVFSSEELLGLRIVVLTHLADGWPEVLDLYEELPSYEQANEIVRSLLGAEDEERQP